MSNPAAIGVGRFLPSDVQIEAEAARMAAMCRRGGFQNALQLVERAGVSVPRGESCFTQNARMKCERWWFKQLRRVHWRLSENAARDDGRVWKRGELYCSDHAVARVRARRSNAVAFMGKMAARNKETGEVVTLADAAGHNLSSTAVRRAEMMARTKGMEHYARSKNWRGEFWTVSTPSRYHARHHDGRRNVRWRGATPGDARDWLQRDVWAPFRAGMADAEIDYCALRVAEPHHDGTPHLHILIFFPRDRANEAGEIMARLALADDPPPRAEVRFKAEIIKRGRSAVGYVAKYVCKAIDGHGVHGVKVRNPDTGELETVPVSEADSAERIRAWASIWGIRQFQFSGLAKVGPYRELRRVESIKGAVPEALLAIHQAARGGSFVDYMLHDSVGLLDTFTGEETRGEYGDRIRAVEGVTFGAFDLETRGQWEVVPMWVLEQAGGFVPLPQTTSQAPCLPFPGGVSPAPWTRLNNCREYPSNEPKPPPNRPPRADNAGRSAGGAG